MAAEVLRSGLTATSLAAVAAVTAASAYADAKWHIGKDVTELWRKSKAEASLRKAVKSQRASLWYNFEAECLRKDPKAECIWFNDRSYTWADTYKEALAYAHFFLSKGVEPGSLVGLYLSNRPEFCFAMLGLWAIGSAPALINNTLEGDPMVHSVKLSGTSLLLVDDDVEFQARINRDREQLEAAGVTIMVLSGAEGAASNPSAQRPSDSLRAWMNDDSPVFLVYTSGSTGAPKACHMPVRSGLIFGETRIAAMGLNPDVDRWYNCMPMYHGTGATTVMACLSSGVALCIGTKFEPATFWRDIRSSRATIFTHVGETARYLLTTPESPLDKDHSLRISYGNGMRPDVWQGFRDRFGIETIVEFFHSSEGALVLLNVCKGDYARHAVGHQGALMRLVNGSSHTPVAVDYETGQLWRDEDTGFCRQVPWHQGGEIIVKVQGSGREYIPYWRNPDATAKKLEHNVFQKGDCYYRTGDVLRRTPDGMWFFSDRIADTFRWKGRDVATADVAEVMGSFSGVGQALVYGVAVPGHKGRAGMATLNLTGQQTTDKEDTLGFLSRLMQHCQKRLPAHAIPVFVRLAESTYAMHNNKQNKLPLKKEGYNLDLIYGEENDAQTAIANGKDLVFWCPRLLGNSTADRWTVLDRKSWQSLVDGVEAVTQAKL